MITRTGEIKNGDFQTTANKYYRWIAGNLTIIDIFKVVLQSKGEEVEKLKYQLCFSGTSSIESIY